LITNIIELKSAAMNKRVAFCIEAHPFQIKEHFGLKNLDITKCRMDRAARLPPYLMFSDLRTSNPYLLKGQIVFLNGSYKLASNNKE
jgi:hypothetical protein